MADDLTGPIWVCDTEGAKSSEILRIERIAWKKATTAGHLCQVVDSAGKVIWEHIASGANFAVSEEVFREVTGLTVSDLDSGKLYISLAKRPKSF